MHSEVRAVLVQHRRNQGAIGTSLLFPHPRTHRHLEQPVTRHLAAWWLKEAFRKAKLAKPEGSLWHMFAWATDRKHLPPKDVAAAGGWLDIGTCYQQPDPQTLREVVEFQRVEPAHRSVGRRPRPIGAWRRSRELRLDSHRDSHRLQIGEARQR